MKHLLNILLVALFAVAVAQLYRGHMELKYNYESLALREKSQTDQFSVILATSVQRTHRDAQKIAALEAQIRTLTAANGRAN